VLLVVLRRLTLPGGNTLTVVGGNSPVIRNGSTSVRDFLLYSSSFTLLGPAVVLCRVRCPCYRVRSPCARVMCGWGLQVTVTIRGGVAAGMAQAITIGTLSSADPSTDGTRPATFSYSFDVYVPGEHSHFQSCLRCGIACLLLRCHCCWTLLTSPSHGMRPRAGNATANTTSLSLSTGLYNAFALRLSQTPTAAVSVTLSPPAYVTVLVSAELSLPECSILLTLVASPSL
jgi:hypothetical protein